MVFLSVGDAIRDALRSLMLSLCDIIYKLIIFFFNIFEMIGTASILRDSTVQEIYQRVGLILGLFMVLKVTFSLIQYVINPDLLQDKQKGLFNIVKKLVIVIVLLGVTPSLFRLAFDVQDLIVDSNIIPRVISGTNVGKSDNFGGNLAWYTFSSFFEKNAAYNTNQVCSELNEINGHGSALENQLTGNKPSLKLAFNCVNLVDEESVSGRQYMIDFEGDGLIPVLVGAVILWLIVMYTIQVGIRVIQLAYLQLIAPIPIILYLDPKNDERLTKWFKQCTTTYLDFFIRMAIIYLVVFIIDLLIGSNNDYFLSSLGTTSGVEQTYITIIMILALLVFAKKVPDLFKELFPSASGAAKFDFGLSPSKVFNDTWAAGLIGGTVGALGAGASNTIHGFRNMSSAWKENQVNMKKWNDLTEKEREGLDKDEYNAKRRALLMKRNGAVAGAAFRGVASVAGGVIGGGMAGLKTKDITKSGEAIKTANANREKRELREKAGYTPFHVIGDKILEFAGETEAMEVAKNRQQALIDSKARQERFDRGAEIANTATYTSGDNEGKLNPEIAFGNEEFRKSYNEVDTAKKNLKIAGLQLSQAQAQLNSSYSYNPTLEQLGISLNAADYGIAENDPQKEMKLDQIKAKIIADAKAKKVAEATKIFEQAQKNNKTLEGQLELAKVKHDENRKIYVKDAQIEDDFKYWHDMMEIQEGYVEIPELKVEKIQDDNPMDAPLSDNADFVNLSVDELEAQIEAVQNEYDMLYGFYGDADPTGVVADTLAKLERLKHQLQVLNGEEHGHPAASVETESYTMEDLEKAKKDKVALERLWGSSSAGDRNIGNEIREAEKKIEKIKDYLIRNGKYRG